MLGKEDALMPLRDHFHPPLDDVTSWEGFHGQWPAMIVQTMVRKLPRRYVAAPRVHSGSDIYKPDRDEYEVRVYDIEQGRRQVAVVKIVSPDNKDHPEHRRAFVAKCAALLQQLVSVTIIDLVTIRNFNLYGDLLELIGKHDPALDPEPPPLYAVACRQWKRGDTWQLETWMHGLTLGQPLSTLPLWLAENLAVPLELEECYEETCRVLRIV
jgi:hypothetical protein